MGLANSSEEPVAVRDVLTEDNLRLMCAHLETVDNVRGRKYCTNTINMYSRMWSVVGAIFLEPGTVDAWKAQVSHRTHDAAKSRDDNGDLDNESDEANKATFQTPVTFLDMVHRRRRFLEATTKMAVNQGSSEWPPAHWPEATVESQRILLSRRKAALVASFLLTHAPPLRDDAGCSLVWNRHLKMMNVKGRKVFQYRKIGPSVNKTSGLGRRALKMGATDEPQFSIVTLPPWLGDMVDDYVRTDLPRIAGEAFRKFWPWCCCSA